MIVWLAVPSIAVEKLATPLTSAAVPSAVEPSEKMTDPEGTGPLTAATVAVKFTLVPGSAFAGDDTSCRDVADGVTSRLVCTAVGVTKIAAEVGVNCTESTLVPAFSRVPAAGL